MQSFPKTCEDYLPFWVDKFFFLFLFFFFFLLDSLFNIFAGVIIIWSKNHYSLAKHIKLTIKFYTLTWNKYLLVVKFLWNLLKTLIKWIFTRKFFLLIIFFFLFSWTNIIFLLYGKKEHRRRWVQFVGAYDKNVGWYVMMIMFIQFWKHWFKIFYVFVLFCRQIKF